MTDEFRRGYKAKTISSVISRKIDAWLKTVEDKTLAADLAEGIIVTGGAIASMLLGERVSDFDVYLRTPDLAFRVAKYYVDRFTPKKRNGIAIPIVVDRQTGRIRIIAKSAGVASAEGAESAYGYFEGGPDENGASYVGEVMRGVTDDPDEIDDLTDELRGGAKDTAAEIASGPKYQPVFVSTNAITLSDKLQIILRFTGDPDAIHANYDFVHCTNYWASWARPQLILRAAALEALLCRELRYVGSLYPICSIIRTRKFLKRGWVINAGQYLKMAMQVSELDLKNPKVLEDQLTGVDVAYFAQLIDRLKEKAGDSGRIESAYVVEIVDRLF